MVSAANGNGAEGGPSLASTDIVVVGAGIAGVCTAHELRRRGFDVVLVEQRFPAFGASGRGPGALWLQARRSGAELAIARAAKAAYAGYAELVGDVFDYRVDGGLFFYETPEQAAVLDDYVADRRRCGLDVELLTADDAAAHSPLLPDTAGGAVWCADDAQVDVQAFVGALTRACVRDGVRKYENTAVLSTLRSRDRVVGVRTVRGDIRASGVVWATGAWATNLRAEGVTLPLATARMGCVLTQPVEQRPSAVVRGPRGVAGCGALRDLPGFDPAVFAPPSPGGDGLVGYDDFIASNRDGQFHIGGSIDGRGSLNPHISARATASMIATFAERYERYADLGITGLWAGLVSETADDLPIVDRVGGVYVNVGHSWGIASGPVSAQVIADIITDDPNPLREALRADRPALVPRP